MPFFRSAKPERSSGRAARTWLLACCATSIAISVSAAGADPMVSEIAQARSAEQARAAEPAPYASPVATYRKFQPQPVEDWPTLNQTVGEVGGWRTYGMEIYLDRQRREQGEQQ